MGTNFFGRLGLFRCIRIGRGNGGFRGNRRRYPRGYLRGDPGKLTNAL